MPFSLILALILGWMVVACRPTEPAERAQRVPGPPAPRAVQLIHATILANGCQELGRAEAKRAEAAMYKLVEGCSSVPGGGAQFAATLLPSGRIQIAAAPGQPDVVPICILKHSLLHNVPLAKPCRLDVKIEEISVPVGLDGG
jgi:hypothetical protein